MTINNETIKKLGFDTIRDEVKLRAIGDYTKERIETLETQNNLQTVLSWQQETKEARLLLESNQHVPFMGLTRIEWLFRQVQRGQILTPSELIEVADFLRSNRLIRKFFEKNQYQAPLLHSYALALPERQELEEELYRKIDHQQVADDASRELRKLRRRVQETEKEIQDKLQKFLRNKTNQTYLQERMILKKGDHYTIPIKASFKNKVAGTLIEQSNKGGTAFIEPITVAKATEELQLLESAVVAEEYQILAELSGLLYENEQAVLLSIEAVTALDLIFARAKYSREIQGITPKVNKSERIDIKNGRHPLLHEQAVPLNFALGDYYRGLVITGANAGGKTVVLKTVGLLTLMTMFGLQIPAQEGTEIAVMDDVFVDIGDQQDLANSLSTFSGHMKNTAHIVKHAGRHTLVLLDEIGSGTEPNEGAALAIALMETMYEKGALVVTTTHFGEIKRFAEQHEDFVPAAMSFDQETLAPTYQLTINQIGESQALWIARKMAMPDALLARADQYIHQKNYALNKRTFTTKEQPVDERVSKGVQWQKGDRVFLTEKKRSALVFEDDGEESVIVFYNKEKHTVLRKRLVFERAATELYPREYDVDSLFVSFQERKERKDLERGSKKARKELEKRAKNRRID